MTLRLLPSLGRLLGTSWSRGRTTRRRSSGGAAAQATRLRSTHTTGIPCAGIRGTMKTSFPCQAQLPLRQQQPPQALTARVSRLGLLRSRRPIAPSLSAAASWPSALVASSPPELRPSQVAAAAAAAVVPPVAHSRIPLLRPTAEGVAPPCPPFPRTTSQRLSQAIHTAASSVACQATGFRRAPTHPSARPGP
jgi:hypothetical protein